MIRIKRQRHYFQVNINGRPVGAWYHVTIVQNDNEIVIYVNGKDSRWN